VLENPSYRLERLLNFPIYCETDEAPFGVIFVQSNIIVSSYVLSILESAGKDSRLRRHSTFDEIFR